MAFEDIVQAAVLSMRALLKRSLFQLLDRRLGDGLAREADVVVVAAEAAVGAEDGGGAVAVEVGR